MEQQQGDRGIVEQAQKDPRQFRVLYDMYVDQIYRFIYYRVSQHQETAEDLTSEVFAKALHALPKFQYQGYAYSTYLYQVARSVCADYYKKHRDVADIAEVEVSDAAAAQVRVENAADSTLLWEKIAELPVTLQEIVRLRYIEDLSHEEIGKVVGKSPGAVRTALSRALDQLHDMYEHD